MGGSLRGMRVGMRGINLLRGVGAGRREGRCEVDELVRRLDA